jgi:hypothetical protein
MVVGVEAPESGAELVEVLAQPCHARAAGSSRRDHTRRSPYQGRLIRFISNA